MVEGGGDSVSGDAPQEEFRPAHSPQTAAWLYRRVHGLLVCRGGRRPSTFLHFCIHPDHHIAASIPAVIIFASRQPQRRILPLLAVNLASSLYLVSLSPLSSSLPRLRGASATGNWMLPRTHSKQKLTLLRDTPKSLPCQIFQHHIFLN